MRRGYPGGVRAQTRTRFRPPKRTAAEIGRNDWHQLEATAYLAASQTLWAPQDDARIVHGLQFHALAGRSAGSMRLTKSAGQAMSWSTGQISGNASGQGKSNSAPADRRCRPGHADDGEVGASMMIAVGPGLKVPEAQSYPRWTASVPGARSWELPPGRPGRHHRDESMVGFKPSRFGGDRTVREPL
jgi:hypothetical protein